MNAELKEMQRLLEEINLDIQSMSANEISRPVKKARAGKSRRLESMIREEFAEIKKMIKEIDNQSIADSVAKAVVNQITTPLQEALGSIMSGKSEARSIGAVAEDMKRKVERLSDRHIRVIKCLSQANGEWVNYDYLSGACRISQSCLRGYISDLKRIYEIPIETSQKSGKTHVRMDAQNVKRLALGYHAAKVNAA